MKLSETTGEQRKTHLEYVDNRWKQLYDMSNERAEKAWAYLMLINSGSAVAVLSFMGANKSLTPIPSAPLMLLCFLLGLVLVGVGHATAYYRSMWLYTGWRDNVGEYFEDKITWHELLDHDRNRSRYFIWADVVAWGAFISFLTGVGVGISSAMRMVN
jgi:hypothetical protein